MFLDKNYIVGSSLNGSEGELQKLPIEAVRQWTTDGAIRYPASISTIYPHCGDKVVFAPRHADHDQARLAVAESANCPSCNRKVDFWAVRHSKIPKGDIDNLAGVFMYPPAQNHYLVPEFSPKVPEQLQRSFVSTVDAFNAKNYAATAVCGRRTLEGIFKFLVPEDKRKETLARLIELAKTETDLAAPLTTLSHAIRSGGNLGAHFDMEKEPSEVLARQMVELLEYLISYLYTLPDKIKKLEQSLEHG